MERRGIVTAAVSMMPEITRVVGLPRVLNVPFGLGAPFEAPNDPEAQENVLRALLRLAEAGRQEAEYRGTRQP